MNETPTPRVDRQNVKMPSYECMIALARQLERELAEATTSRRQWHSEVLRSRTEIALFREKLEKERNLTTLQCEVGINRDEELETCQARIAGVKKELSESFELAESELANEKLGGNVVKEEFWKGELGALHRVRIVLAASEASDAVCGDCVSAGKHPVALDGPASGSFKRREPSCWLCGKPSPDEFIVVECETPGGMKCSPKKVPVHSGCLQEVEP